jgi:hypothetical protein
MSGPPRHRQTRPAGGVLVLALCLAACSSPLGWPGPYDTPLDAGVLVSDDGSLRLLLVDCLGRQLLGLSVGFSEEPTPYVTDESPLWQLDEDRGGLAPYAGPDVLTVTVGQSPPGLRETPKSDWPDPAPQQHNYLVINWQVGSLGTGHVFATADLRPGWVALPIDREPVTVERFIEEAAGRCAEYAPLRNLE